MLILDAGLLETTNQWCSWNKAAKLWDALGQVNPELNPGVDLYLQIQDHWNSWSCGPWSWRMAKYATSKCQVKRRTSSQVVTVWFGGRLYENICCLGWLPKKIQLLVRMLAPFHSSSFWALTGKHRQMVYEQCGLVEKEMNDNSDAPF